MEPSGMRIPNCGVTGAAAVPFVNCSRVRRTPGNHKDRRAGNGGRSMSFLHQNRAEHQESKSSLTAANHVAGAWPCYSPLLVSGRGSSGGDAAEFPSAFFMLDFSPL